MSQPVLHRDAQDRVNPGTSGGPSGSFNRHTANLRKAFVEAFTTEDMVKVASKIFFSSLRGNMTAARMVLQYCIGRPGPAVDPDTAERSANHGEHRGHGERQEEKLEPAGTVETVKTAVVEEQKPRGHGARQDEKKGEAGTVATEITVEEERRGHGENEGEAGTVATEITAVQQPRGHGEWQVQKHKVAGTVETGITEKTAGWVSPANGRETAVNGLLATAHENGA